MSSIKRVKPTYDTCSYCIFSDNPTNKSRIDYEGKVSQTDVQLSDENKFKKFTFNEAIISKDVPVFTKCLSDVLTNVLYGESFTVVYYGNESNSILENTFSHNGLVDRVLYGINKRVQSNKELRNKILICVSIFELFPPETIVDHFSSESDFESTLEKPHIVACSINSAKDIEVLIRYARSLSGNYIEEVTAPGGSVPKSFANGIQSCPSHMVCRISIHNNETNSLSTLHIVASGTSPECIKDQIDLNKYCSGITAAPNGSLASVIGPLFQVTAPILVLCIDSSELNKPSSKFNIQCADFLSKAKNGMKNIQACKFDVKVSREDIVCSTVEEIVPQNVLDIILAKNSSDESKNDGIFSSITEESLIKSKQIDNISENENSLPTNDMFGTNTKGIEEDTKINININQNKNQEDNEDEIDENGSVENNIYKNNNKNTIQMKKNNNIFDDQDKEKDIAKNIDKKIPEKSFLQTYRELREGLEKNMQTLRKLEKARIDAENDCRLIEDTTDELKIKAELHATNARLRAAEIRQVSEFITSGYNQAENNDFITELEPNSLTLSVNNDNKETKNSEKGVNAKFFTKNILTGLSPILNRYENDITNLEENLIKALHDQTNQLITQSLMSAPRNMQTQVQAFGNEIKKAMEDRINSEKELIQLRKEDREWAVNTILRKIGANSHDQIERKIEEEAKIHQELTKEMAQLQSVRKELEEKVSIMRSNINETKRLYNGTQVDLANLQQTTKFVATELKNEQTRISGIKSGLRINFRSARDLVSKFVGLLQKEMPMLSQADKQKKTDLFNASTELLRCLNEATNVREEKDKIRSEIMINSAAGDVRTALRKSIELEEDIEKRLSKMKVLQVTPTEIINSSLSNSINSRKSYTEKVISSK